MSSKSRFIVGLLPVLAVLAPLVSPQSASAIAAFARAHKTECSTCHTIYPELNEFGEAFLRNSYVYPGKGGAKGAAKPEPARTEGLWLSGLPEQLPLSLTATLDLAYDKDAANHDQLDLSSRSIRLQAGGAFREAAGFFATYNLYAQGIQSGSDNNPRNAGSELNELFAIWRHALNSPVNVRIGRMEPKLSLWKKTNRVILVPSFASTTYRVGHASAIDAITGLPATDRSSQESVDTPRDALEVSALLGNRVLVAGGVVDKNGQNGKEGFGHISAKFGGTDFAGHEPEVDLEKESVWDYLALTVGAFGYSGKNGFIVSQVAENKNTYYRAGAEFDLLYKRMRLKGSGVFGRDSNPEFLAAGTPEKSHAYAVEGEYQFGSPVNLMAVLRYEAQSNAAGVTRRYIPAVAYAPLQNTKLALQYNYEDEPARINRTTIASLAFSF